MVDFNVAAAARPSTLELPRSSQKCFLRPGFVNSTKPRREWWWHPQRIRLHDLKLQARLLLLLVTILENDIDSSSNKNSSNKDKFIANARPPRVVWSRRDSIRCRQTGPPPPSPSDPPKAPCPVRLHFRRPPACAEPCRLAAPPLPLLEPPKRKAESCPLVAGRGGVNLRP